MNSRAPWPRTGEAVLAIFLATAAAHLAARDPIAGRLHSFLPWEAAGVSAARVPPVPAAAQAALPAPLRPAELPGEEEYHRFAPIVEEASRAHGVDAALVHAVILTESSYDPRARSPAGASGLMQLMPVTAKHYGAKDVFDPRQNVRAGVKYLSDLLRQFNGDLELALAAYNAGTTAVIRAGRRIPPFAETQAYVPKVIDSYRRLRALES